MKNRFLVLAFMAMAGIANAQYTPTPLQRGNPPVQHEEDSTGKKGFDKQRLVFGGNLGASFGNWTFVNVSPQVGYMFNQYITAGAGINFIHQAAKYFVGNQYAYKTSITYAGLNTYARVFPVRFLFLSAQPELNYSWGKTKFNNDYSQQEDFKLDGKFVPSLLVGAGAVLSPNGRGGMFLSLQYDVIQNVRSPYGSRPYLNIGFGF